MKQTVLFLTIFLAVGSISVESAQLVVPTDYPNVSDALAASVAGDEIQILPGTYTDTKYWNVPSAVAILGLGQFPSAVCYTIPCDISGDLSILLHTDCLLQNLQVGTPNAKNVVHVNYQSSGIQINSVIFFPMYRSGIDWNPGSSGTMSQCTLIGPNAPPASSFGVVSGANSVITNCVIVNFKHGINEPGTETFNLFWDVDYPCGYDDEPNPSDIVNIADPMLDPTTFAPGYGSLAIDSGDPGFFDPDGTYLDRGAVYRSQILYTLGFLADPGDTVGIGLPRRQGLPPRMFHAGDRFVLGSRLVKTTNPPNMASEPTTAYLVLDVFGTYYWAPAWSTSVTSVPLSVTDGLDDQEIVFDFIWPEVDGSASGLCFWATTITDVNGWVGPIACLEFGYE